MNNTYVVQAGDTLYGIARQHNTSVQRIKELNKLTNENIYQSQVLIRLKKVIIYIILLKNTIQLLMKLKDITI